MHLEDFLVPFVELRVPAVVEAQLEVERVEAPCLISEVNKVVDFDRRLLQVSPRVELNPQIMASDSLVLPVKIFSNSVSSLLFSCSRLLSFFCLLCFIFCLSS